MDFRMVLIGLFLKFLSSDTSLISWSSPSPVRVYPPLAPSGVRVAKRRGCARAFVLNLFNPVLFEILLLCVVFLFEIKLLEERVTKV